MPERHNAAWFGVAYLVAYVEPIMSLRPGDVISLGNPPGVGSAKTAEGAFSPGQRMRLECGPRHPRQRTGVQACREMLR